VKQISPRQSLGGVSICYADTNRIRPLVEITSTIGRVWMRICVNRSKQRWPGPSRASAGIFSLS
jgi:hypothetical protein